MELLLALTLFAQSSGTYGGNSSYSSGGDPFGAILGNLCCCGFYLILVGPMFAGMWKVFDKAGEPGWYALIPVYNVMVLARLAGKEENYGLLCLIPCAGIVFYIMILIDLCNEFDQGGGFAVGLAFLAPIFWPILGFGSAEYRGGRGGRRRLRDDDYDRPRRSRDDDDDDRPRRPRPPRDDNYREHWGDK